MSRRWRLEDQLGSKVIFNYIRSLAPKAIKAIKIEKVRVWEDARTRSLPTHYQTELIFKRKRTPFLSDSVKLKGGEECVDYKKLLE